MTGIIVRVSFAIVALVGGYLYTLRVLRPPFDIVLLGASAGLLAAAVLSRTKKDERRPVEELVLQSLTMSTPPLDVSEGQAVRNFDAVFPAVERELDPEKKAITLRRLGPPLYELTQHMPKWSGEARLRVFYLIKNMAPDAIRPRDASTYVATLILMLRNGGEESIEMVSPFFLDKILAMSGDERYAKTKFLAASLLLLHAFEPEYSKKLAGEACNFWSEDRFETLRPDFRILNTKPSREAVTLYLVDEASKARKEGKNRAAHRCEELLRAINM